MSLQNYTELRLQRDKLQQRLNRTYSMQESIRKKQPIGIYCPVTGDKISFIHDHSQYPIVAQIIHNNVKLLQQLIADIDKRLP